MKTGFLKYGLLCWASALFALLLAGCVGESYEPANPGPDDSTPGVWVSLRIGFKDESADTRGPASTPVYDSHTCGTDRQNSPRPGNWGDGKEPGIWNEYFIEDLNIFFFKEGESRLGLDTPGHVSLFNHRYVSNTDLVGPDGAPATEDDPLKYVDHIYEYKYKVTEENQPEPGDFIIVVANYGESLADVHTLEELCKMTAAHSWRPGLSVSECSWFLMSNAYNNQYDRSINRVMKPEAPTPEEVGSSRFPFTGNVYLQRAAARIDLLYGQANLPDEYDTWIQNAGSLKYPVDKSTAIVELTHIYPVNVKQRDTYLLKHVTTGTDIPLLSSTAINICGDEKTIVDNQNIELPDNYVVDCMSIYKSMQIPPANLMSEAWYGSTARGKYLADWAAGGESADASIFPASRGMARIIDAHTPISAVADGFDYASVITYAEENTQGSDVEISDFATGLLLRAVYHPKNVYGNVDGYGRPSGAVGNYGYQGTFWRYMPNLTAAAGGMSVNNLTDAKALYFSSQNAAEAYRAAHPEESATITRFENGVCYYNVWVRHADVEEGIYDRPIPMEFAIVRNNLYRISFTFGGPGTPDLEIREPFNVRPRIFVRPWNVRLHPEIIL